MVKPALFVVSDLICTTVLITFPAVNISFISPVVLDFTASSVGFPKRLPAFCWVILVKGGHSVASRPPFFL